MRLAKHISIIHVESDINALSALLLEEIAGIKLRLREALHVHELIHGGAIPDPPSISLAIQLEQVNLAT